MILETGRTYGELDVLFERKVPARKFKHTQVAAFRGDSVVLRPDEDEEKAGPGMVEQFEKA